MKLGKGCSRWGRKRWCTTTLYRVSQTLSLVKEQTAILKRKRRRRRKMGKRKRRRGQKPWRKRKGRKRRSFSPIRDKRNAGVTGNVASSVRQTWGEMARKRDGEPNGEMERKIDGEPKRDMKKEMKINMKGI